MSAYMRINNISGSVTATGLEKTIALNSVSFGMWRRASLRVGRTNSREISPPVFSEMNIGKEHDDSSAVLFSHACQGVVIPKVTILLCQVMGKMTPYGEIHLSNVVITSVKEHVDITTQRLNEYYSLNYTQINKQYITSRGGEMQLQQHVTGYDLATATVV